MVAREPGFLLYQRDDCHLCDRAIDVLAQARLPDFDSVFVDDDATLEAAYGHRLPVLRRDDGAELDWPFDAATVADWVGGTGVCK
ncbi:MAG: glutaredoxin family protein [Lysobacteraceae bacterium]